MCTIDDLRNAVTNGITKTDVEEFMRECDFKDLARVANELTWKITGDTATVVNNVVINYSNICVAQCPICAFYRPKGHPEAYVRTPEEITKGVLEAKAHFGVTELHINGGFNPDLGIEYFENVFRSVKRAAPDVTIKGPTAAEIDFYARVWRMSTREVLTRLREAGLDALSGGGAEILNEEVRRVITPYKFNAETWLRIQEEAHRVGLMSNATMLYGHIEKPSHIVEHVFAIKEVQEKTHGILLFIPIKFVPWNTKLYKDGLVKGPASTEYDIKVIAISRLILGDSIKRIGAYWISTGKRLISTLLMAGANDLVGTMINEQVLRQAGSRESVMLNELAHIAREAGLRLFLRDTFHRIITEVSSA
ncbi:MAG: CofH family radical SAM protein [Vulcanisaeta sp.]|uniref:Radical SAM domain protein n=1 Tax=Vulcanisaeta moutnovskia (strain 768-28) TaxID=985053 RepID=F0QSP5_VULM7|nr:CofH family radical SAM protein [Vulcanisaeta moutnovskia]ADY01562.1 Radical SAM domain protein [Vulcanisaeta moutnovskia 768-28]